MKTVLKMLVAVLLLAPVVAMAQSGNVFLSRDFWSGNPSIEEIEQKISEGNDPEEMNGSNFNGIVYAILNRLDSDKVVYLLKRDDTDMNRISHDGRTYLHWAAMAGQVEVMKYLVDHGINKPVTDDHGYTELAFAATTGQQDTKVYDFLLANGSKLTESNHHGANPLLLLIPHLNSFELVDYFVEKGIPLDTKDDDGNGVFYYVAQRGNIEMMDKLIAKGVDYKGVNKIGGNAMIAAAQGGRRNANSLEVFKYLDKKGIKANIITDEGLTPILALAGSVKDLEILEFFMDKGVKINHTDKDGNNALINAAGRNDLSVIKFIADKTKSVNTSNKDGETALTRAVASNSLEVVSYFIEKGADVNVVDKDGNNLTFYLLKSYRPGRTEGYEKKKAILKGAGVNMKAEQAKGNTLFHLAAQENDLYLLKEAHSLGLDVNKANDLGTTPIQIAAMKASDDTILKYLLEIGANKEVVTDFEESVYDLASENEALQRNNVNINFLKSAK